MYTDVAVSIGFSAIFGNNWCYGSWPDNWIGKNIAILEFYPFVLSLSLWGNQLRNQCVLFFTDNEASVHVINKQSCRDPSLMSFVRKLVSICLQYNILFIAKHIPRVHNTLGDYLSRLQVASFKKMAPVSMSRSPTEIPPHLLPQNWQM